MVLLDKKGNSSSNERKKFIEQILSIILKEMIEEQFNPFSSSDIKKNGHYRHHIGVDLSTFS
jgi:hypothetical protein